MRFPRIARWRHDKKIEEAKPLDDLESPDPMSRGSIDQRETTVAPCTRVRSVIDWFAAQGWTTQTFRREVWEAMIEPPEQPVERTHRHREKPTQLGNW